jgi:hypothetical protein
MASDPSTPLLRVDPPAAVTRVQHLGNRLDAGAEAVGEPEPLPAYADACLAPGDVLTVDTLRGDPATGRAVRETRAYRRDRLCAAVHGSHLFTRLLAPGRMVCLRCLLVRPAP